MSKIIPTVGRKLYFYPPRTPTGAATGLWNVISETQPLDATVLYVHNESTINVMVTDHRGNMRFQDFVQLVQEGGQLPDHKYPYCKWMPYQVGQAPSASDVQRRLESLEAAMLNVAKALPKTDG